MKTLYRLTNVDGDGNCPSCGFERGEVGYLIAPPGDDPIQFAEQNGALDAECAMNLLFEVNGMFILPAVTVKMVDV